MAHGWLKGIGIGSSKAVKRKVRYEFQKHLVPDSAEGPPGGMQGCQP